MQQELAIGEAGRKSGQKRRLACPSGNSATSGQRLPRTREHPPIRELPLRQRDPEPRERNTRMRRFDDADLNSRACYMTRMSLASTAPARRSPQRWPACALSCKPCAAALAIVALIAGCSAPTAVPDASLPILTDYPTSINATAATGTIQLQPDGCLVFTRSDGERLLPVFRKRSSIEKLRAQLGDLIAARPVAIMGMTMLDPVPREVERFQSGRACNQMPFVFGSFRSGAVLPPPAPTDPL